MNVSRTFALPPHLEDLTVAHGDLQAINGRDLVVVSSVMFRNIDGSTEADPLGYETARFQASLAASRNYAAHDVLQLVFVDAKSDYRVPMRFAEAGALVIMTPRPGLATPYLDGALLVKFYGDDNTSVIKAEADKSLTAEDIAEIRRRLGQGYDVLVGDRTVTSLESMSAIQQDTETVLDATLADMLDIPRGASSGVQVYSPAGIGVFLGYEDFIGTLGNNWKYLLLVPALARQAGLKVEAVALDFVYDEAMVAIEAQDVNTHLKRLEQLLLMLQGGLEVRGVLERRFDLYLAPSDQRKKVVGDQLATLRAALRFKALHVG